MRLGRLAPRFAPLCALALLAPLLAPTRSIACSVCEPGDPLFSPQGVTAQSRGSVSFYLEARQSWKRSGALSHHDDDEGHGEGHGEEEERAGRDREENFTRETILYASWAPLERLTLSTRLPFRWITIEEQPAGGPHHRLHNRGLGDVSLFGTGTLWRNRSTLPSSWLEGRLMLKVPTGKRDERVEGELDPHLQLGSGSWDWGVGLGGVHRFERLSLYASAFYRFNARGALDYEYGDVFLANLALTSDALHLGLPAASALRTGTELNFRYAGKDDFRGRSYGDSGGSIFYLSPFLEAKLGASGSERAPALRLAARLPLGSGGLNGSQREGYVYSAGLRFGF